MKITSQLDACVDSYVPPMPELSLLRGVLEQAINDFQLPKNGYHGKKIAKEARKWFESTESANAFSFEGACLYLHLSPEAVRKQLGL